MVTYVGARRLLAHRARESECSHRFRWWRAKNKKSHWINKPRSIIRCNSTQKRTKSKIRNERRIERIAIPVELQRWLNYLVWPFPIRLIILFLNRKIYTVSDNREIPHGYAPSITLVFPFLFHSHSPWRAVVDYFNVYSCICAKKGKVLMIYAKICMHSRSHKHCENEKNLWKVVVSLPPPSQIAYMNVCRFVSRNMVHFPFFTSLSRYLFDSGTPKCKEHL